MPHNKMNTTEFKDLIKRQEKNILGKMEHEMYVNQFTFRNGKSIRDKIVSVPGSYGQQYQKQCFSLDGSKIF